jgi:hypothetical protein
VQLGAASLADDTKQMGKTMQFLFQLDEVFEIRGRGCVLVPGVPYKPLQNVVAGSPIVIERPDGSRLETMILAFEMINRGRPMEHAPFSVPKHISKEELPPGSQVFLK